MQTLAAIISGIAKVAGTALIMVALLAATGHLFPANTPSDDIAAAALLALAEGVLYILPMRIWLKNNRRVLLFVAATLFVPFLVALAAVQYGIHSAALTPQVTGNLMSAAVAFLVSLCPPAALLLARKRRLHPEPKD
ncbi:MAG: hypothetical protein ABIL58_17195 [Pseudomonadota bacterium]